MLLNFIQFISNIFTAVFNLFSLFKMNRETSCICDTEKLQLILSLKTTKSELEEIARKLDAKEIVMDFSQSKFYHNGHVKTLHLQLEGKGNNRNYFKNSMQLSALFLFFWKIWISYEQISNSV